MARRITNRQMTSSVARLLSPAAATAALAPVDRGVSVRQDEHPHAVIPTGRTRHIKREFILSAETDATLCELVAVFNQSTSSRLTASQVVRALLIAVRPALPAIQAAAIAKVLTARPGNASALRYARDAFEQLLGTVIAKGVWAMGK